MDELSHPLRLRRRRVSWNALAGLGAGLTAAVGTARPVTRRPFVVRPSRGGGVLQVPPAERGQSPAMWAATSWAVWPNVVTLGRALPAGVAAEAAGGPAGCGAPGTAHGATRRPPPQTRFRSSRPTDRHSGPACHLSGPAARRRGSRSWRRAAKPRCRQRLRAGPFRAGGPGTRIRRRGTGSRHRCIRDERWTGGPGHRGTLHPLPRRWRIGRHRPGPLKPDRDRMRGRSRRLKPPQIVKRWTAACLTLGHLADPPEAMRPAPATRAGSSREARLVRR